MVKCSKAEVRRLKTALRWKIRAAQRQRIQMERWRKKLGQVGTTAPAGGRPEGRRWGAPKT